MILSEERPWGWTSDRRVGEGMCVCVCGNRTLEIKRDVMVSKFITSTKLLWTTEKCTKGERPYLKGIPEKDTVGW